MPRHLPTPTPRKFDLRWTQHIGRQAHMRGIRLDQICEALALGKEDCTSQDGDNGGCIHRFSRYCTWSEATGRRTRLIVVIGERLGHVVRVITAYFQ